MPNASSPSSSSDPSSSDPAPSPSRPAAPVSGGRPVVLVSNRGPVAFRLADDGALIGRRGAGGLVSGLAPLVTGTDATWIAAAMSDGDRAAADEGVLEADGLQVRLLDLDPDTYRLAYDVVCNATLWFMHHGLWDLPRSPAFGAAFSVAWEAYRAVNAAFADAIVADAPTDAAVLVQDYHLALVAAMVGDRRPDLRLVHFSHTPFAGPDLCRVLPTSIRRELLGGMRAFAACGFHTERWAASFRASCIDVVGDVPDTFVAPLGPDPDDIAATATSPACAAARRVLDDRLGDRLLITRVDRIEPSKNIVRGFAAFDALLEQHERWRGQVVLGAFVYPSREAVPEYQRYRDEVDAAARAVGDRWRTADWEPIIYDDSDDYPGSVAALARADALLVNPIRDGLNLVAKEGPLVNDRHGVLALSTEAGAWAELGGVALAVDPYDVAGTAAVLHRALTMSEDERRRHAADLRTLALARSPRAWLDENLAAAG